MKKVYAIFAALLIAGMTGGTVDLEARSCKSFRTHGKGESRNKTVAKSKARLNWRAKTRLKYGKKWSKWYKAKRKAVTCYKTRKGEHQCTARAYACK